jgi:signal transduction histidine kinase
LFFVVIIPISILLIAITFGSFALHQDAMRDLVATRDQRTVDSSARALGEQLDHRKAVIQSIGIRTMDSLPQDDFLTSVEFLSDDFEAGIAVIGPVYNLIEFSASLGNWQEFETEVIEYLEQSDSGLLINPQISDPFYIKGQDEIFSFIIFQANQNNPIIVGLFSVTELARENLAGILSYDNVGAVLLVDQNINLLYESGLQEIPPNLLDYPGIIEALRGETGTTYLDVDGDEHVIVYSPISTTNWALIIDEPWREITSPLLRYSESGSLVLLPIVILALIALWFGTLKIIQPLKAFQAQAAKFTLGDFKAFNEPVGGIEEIQTLQTTFIGMAVEVEKAQQVLTRYLNVMTEGQEEERKRLARELHDDTLQSLIALNQRIMIAGRMADKSVLRGTLTEIETMLGKTMQELRRLTRALRPIYLEDLGLVSALESLGHEMSDMIGIPISFKFEGVERRLPDNVEIALYRITQEAISNISKHANASKAELTITYNDTNLLLKIGDNGVGFDPPKKLGELSSIGHYGLLGIHERADLLGADFQIQSDSRHGTTITVQVPFQV